MRRVFHFASDPFHKRQQKGMKEDDMMKKDITNWKTEDRCHTAYEAPRMGYADLLCASQLLQNSVNQVDPMLTPGVSAETYSRDGSGFSWDLDV